MAGVGGRRGFGVGEAYEFGAAVVNGRVDVRDFHATLLRVVGIARAALAWLVLFFRAEDGIRDRTVTGVQTCALPISPHRCVVPRAWAGETRNPARPRGPQGVDGRTLGFPEVAPPRGRRMAARRPLGDSHGRRRDRKSVV